MGVVMGGAHGLTSSNIFERIGSRWLVPIVVTALAASTMTLPIAGVAHADGEVDVRAYNDINPSAPMVVGGAGAVFMLAAGNDGSQTAPDVGLTDQIPPEFEIDLLEDPWNACALDPSDSQLVVCSFGDIPAGQVRWVNVWVTPVVATASVTNTATATTSAAQVPDLAPDSTSVTVEVIDGIDTSVDLEITQTVSQNTMTVGETGQLFELQVNNRSTWGARNVVLSNLVPAEFAIDSVTSYYGEPCDVVGQQVTCSTPLLFAGGSIGATVQVTPVLGTAGAPVTNTAVVTSDTPETVPEVWPNSAAVDITIDGGAPLDSDGDGITDDLDSDPGAASSTFADASGSAGEILTNTTGAPVTLVDLPAPEGVKVIVGGTSGQVTLDLCGGYGVTAVAGSEFDLTCGSLTLTAVGSALTIVPPGDGVLSIEIPAGTTARISTVVNDDFTIEVLAGPGPVVVDDGQPGDPWDPGSNLRYVYPGWGALAFTSNVRPTVESTTLSAYNVLPGEQVDLTAEFSDPGVNDTHTCEVTWATGVTTPGTVTGSTCTASHTYTTAGLNDISVQVTDDAGDSGYGGTAVLVITGDDYWTLNDADSFQVMGSSGLEGIAVDPANGDIWVVNGQSNTVEKFTSDGTFLFQIGGFGTAPGQFNLPSVAVVGNNGDLYVNDIGGDRVQQFTSAGVLVRTFGNTSSGGALALSNPRGIDVDAAGNIYVADIGNGRVQKYSPTGSYIGTLANTGNKPFAVGVDPDGYVWVSDFTNTSNSQVHKIDPVTGVRALTIGGFGQPVDFSFDTVGQVHIVNFNDKTIRTHTLDGTLVDSRPTPVVQYTGGSAGQPYPARSAIDPGGRLLLSSGAGRIMVFDPPTPPDTDADGIPDSLECVPDVAGGFCDPDGGGHTGRVLANTTGAPVTLVDLPAPEGVKVIVGGTSGQVTLDVCGGYGVTAVAGSEFDLTCGSLTLTAVGSALTIVPPGDGVLSIEIPAGTTARISTVVNDDFTIEVLAGPGPVVVDDGQSANCSPRRPNCNLSYVYPADGIVAFTSNVRPTVESTNLSAYNVLPGEQVDLTAEFSDPGVNDTHTCEVTWATGVTTPGTVTGSTCTASHTYTTTGLNDISVQVTDDAGDSGYGGTAVLVITGDDYWTLNDASSFQVDGAYSAIGVDVDPANGDIWLVHNNTNTIAKYSPGGNKLLEVGGFGTAPGQFNSPSVIAVGLDGNVYVTDVGGKRVQQFSSSGMLVRTFGGGPTPFVNPLGIDVDAAGNVWVADVNAGFVRKYSPTGQYLSTLGGTGTAPYAISIDPDGFAWVSDFTGNRTQVHKIDPATGARITTIGGLGQPVDITFDAVGNVTLVNFNDQTIRTYTQDGTLVDIRPTPVVQYTSGSAGQPYPYRVAIDTTGRLLLTNGSPNVLVFDAPVDANGNGIDDSLEVPGTPQKDFDDGSGTTGVVLSGDVVVEDIDPGGVRVTTGTSPATLQMCSGFGITISANSSVAFTCGSITVEALAGNVEITLGGLYTVTVPTGGIARLSDNGDGTYTIENTGSVDVTWIDSVGNTGVVTAGTDDAVNTVPLTTSLRGLEGFAAGSFTKLPASVCNADGSGEIHYTATHPVSGPFSGTMVTNAVVTLGPAAPGGRSPIVGLDGTFTITSGAETITSTLELAPGRQYTPFGTADFMNEASCLTPYSDAYFQVTARFEATGAGGAFTEHGFMTISGANSRSISPSNLASAAFWVAPEITIQSNGEIDEAGRRGTFHQPPEDVGGYPLEIRVFPAAIDPIEIRLTTTDGSATGGSDYTAIDQVITIPSSPAAAYNTTETVIVALDDDTEAEGVETFDATIEVLSGSVLEGRTTLTARIVDNDAPTVAIGDLDVSEGVTGAYTDASVFIDIGTPVENSVYACLAVVGGSATPYDTSPESDYLDSISLDVGCETNTGELGIPVYAYAGQTIPDLAQVATIFGDVRIEGDETIELVVDWIWGGRLAGDGTVTITIVDDDDIDGNGIQDALDLAGTPERDFADGGTTTGEILSGADVVVEDLTDPDGVRVVAGSSAATLRVCDAFTMTLAPGTALEFTCGSVTLNVIAGEASVEFDDGLYTLLVPQGGTAKISGGDGAPFTVENLGETAVTVTDSAGNEVVVEPGKPPVVANTAPTLDGLSAPVDPVRIGTTVVITATVSDPDVTDQLSCTLDWGDGAVSESDAVDGTCSFERNDLEAGVYSVIASATDAQGLTTDGSTQMIVVYDPDGGFVTGGGWFTSEPGAYTVDPAMSGKATFGFVSKYKKGATVPTGNTQFQFKAGDLDFHSSDYDWLVVTGSSYARFKGTGTINGEGAYKFMIWAGDDNPDTFRIKIYDEDGVVYDNGRDQAIGGGSVVIHQAKK